MEQARVKQQRIAERLATLGIAILGLAALGYSAVMLTRGALSFDWLLLSMVTLALVACIDLGTAKTSSVVMLANTCIFISVFLFGAYAAVVLAGLVVVASSLRRKQERQAVWQNMAVMSLSIFVASDIVTRLFGNLTVLSSDLIHLGMAAAALASVYFILSWGLTGVVEAFRQARAVTAVWKESWLMAAISHIASAVMACLILKLIIVLSFYAVILAVPILTILYFTYKVYLDKIETTNRHAEQLSDLHLKTIEALAIAIDAKDEVTQEHVRRVRIYAMGLAQLFGLSEPEVEALKAGALLHDIGKLAVPDYILNKPGPLTAAEFDKMKIHTTVGAEILERVGFPYPVVPVVRHHHERWDGRGYPDGLKGDEIPITARVLTIADSFDSMREERQYRRAMTREQAVMLLKEGSGSVFDPHMVRAFLQHLDEFEAEIREQAVEPQIPEMRKMPGLERQVRADAEPQAFERIRSAHREVFALYDIAQNIGTSLDLRDTFAVFSARLQDIVSYTTCALYLVKPDTTLVEAAHVAGRNVERIKGHGVPSGEGIAGWVVANRHPMHNCDPALDFDAMEIDTGEAYNTATVVPLMKEDTVLGALALYSAELDEYTPDHLRLLEAVAKLISDAVGNAMHHEKAETGALTDSLTRLPNSRALRYRFEEEVDRAQRHRDTFAVMMMDLDGLKVVNDRFGHQAGDELLKELSARLLAQVRFADFISRYAGDEFVAIFQAGPEEIREVAERLQKAVDKRDFVLGNAKVCVGMSVGWACFGMDGTTLDELLLTADRAMYADKVRRKAARRNSNSLNKNDLDLYGAA
jgi:diguanylate cyclase (GGDEF)-like protein/putative nucleotidyltransferase with HDIG domain